MTSCNAQFPSSHRDTAFQCTSKQKVVSMTC